MKGRPTKDRTLQEAAMRAGLRLVHMDIESGVEFYDQTRSHYRKKVQKQKERYDAHPASYWQEDVGYRTTRGELASEEYQGLQEMLQLNSYFGVLTVFAAFERCFLRIFQDMKDLDLVKDKWQKKQGFLKLDEYKEALKSIGVYIAQAPFRWSDIIKLQDLRNAIAHQNGFVTEENIKRLKGYGYKEGQRVEIRDTDFRAAVDLVRDSSTLLVKEYGTVLRKVRRKTSICSTRTIASIFFVPFLLIGIMQIFNARTD